MAKPWHKRVECIIACRTDRAIRRHAKKVWNNTDAVCINVDIALFERDSIDVLSKFCVINELKSPPSSGARPRYVRSMNDVTQKIEQLAPSLSNIREMMRVSAPKLKPWMKEFIEYLQKKKVPIYLLSKSLKVIVSPYARYFNIPEQNLFTNESNFRLQGDFISCIETLPMSKNYGVCLVLQKLKMTHNYSNIALIGSSPEDIDAMQYADVVIGIEPDVPVLPEDKYAHWYVPGIYTIMDAHKGVLQVTKV